MTAAIVALSLALAAAVGGLIGFGIAALAARTAAGKAETEAARLDEQLHAANAATAAQAARADFQEKRANALDAAIVKVAASRPIAGSYELLLQARDNANAANGGDSGLVPDAGDAGDEARTVGPDDLLKPGE